MDARARWIREQVIHPQTDHDEANSSFGLNPAADSEFLLTLLVADLFISQREKWKWLFGAKGMEPISFLHYFLSCPALSSIFSFSHFLARAYGKESS